MAKLSYWECRQLRVKARQLDNTAKLERTMQAELIKTYHDIAKEASMWVDRYAKNQGVNSEQAMKSLQGIKTKHWQMTLKQFEAKAKQGGYETELNNEYYRSRIARLSALEEQMRQLTKGLARKHTATMRTALSKQYDDTYMRTTYNTQAQQGAFTADFARFNETQLKMIVSNPWTKDGKDFSKRIWQNYQQELPSYLMDSLFRATVMGWGPQKVGQMMHAQFQDVQRNRVHNLVTSEMGHIAEEATAKSYEESDIDEYEYMATLESHTCTICGHLDGQRFKMSERQAGVNYPLIHARCRCTTVPFIADLPDVGERWMRDPETGKGKMVKDVKFDEWKQTMVREREMASSSGEYGANLNYVRSQAFMDKLKHDTRTSKISESVATVGRHVLQHRNGTPYEDYYLLDIDTGSVIAVSNQARKTKGVVYNGQVKQAFQDGREGQYVSIHNHPSGFPPSLSDIATLSLKSKENTVGMGLTIGHDGSVYWYTANKIPFKIFDGSQYDKLVTKYVKMGYNDLKAQELALTDFGRKFKFEFGRVD